jgi:alpha-amylase
METGSPETTYVDVTNHIDGTITTNNDGWAEFRCQAGSVSVWVPE